MNYLFIFIAAIIFYALNFLFLSFTFKENIAIYPTENSTEEGSLIKKLFQKLDNLGNEFNNLRQKNQREFNQLREENQREFTQIRKEFNHLREEKKLSDLKMNEIIEDLKHLIKEKKPKGISMKSMVRIEARFNKKNFLTGCGNLIKFYYKFYVVTASHVIKDISSSCACSEVIISYGNSNKTLEVDYQNILIHESNEDIALLPLKISELDSDELKILNDSTVEILEADISVGDSLSGYCPVDGTFVYSYGRVVELNEGNFETDISGTFGWSGCGFSI